MIDHSLAISPMTALVFHLKQGFFMYAWPMLIAFLTVVGYQSLNRIGMAGFVTWPVLFLMASGVSMVSLFGWVMMSRGIERVPLYGIGYGLGTAMMSRVYAVTAPIHPWLKIRIPRVTWRGDKEGIEALQKALRARV